MQRIYHHLELRNLIEASVGEVQHGEDWLSPRVIRDTLAPVFRAADAN